MGKEQVHGKNSEMLKVQYNIPVREINWLVERTL